MPRACSSRTTLRSNESARGRRYQQLSSSLSSPTPSRKLVDVLDGQAPSVLSLENIGHVRDPTGQSRGLHLDPAVRELGNRDPCARLYTKMLENILAQRDFSLGVPWR
jgi:hypothetical protein